MFMITKLGTVVTTMRGSNPYDHLTLWSGGLEISHDKVKSL